MSFGFMSSVPIAHWIKGALFVVALTVRCNFSYNGFRLAFGATTAPLFGFGILPLGPSTLPNAVATFGIMFAWAMKKSKLFASFFTSFLSLYLSKLSERMAESQTFFAWVSSSAATNAHTFTFFPLAWGSVMKVSTWCSCFLTSNPFKFMIKSNDCMKFLFSEVSFALAIAACTCSLSIYFPPTLGSMTGYMEVENMGVFKYI